MTWRNCSTSNPMSVLIATSASLTLEETIRRSLSLPSISHIAASEFCTVNPSPLLLGRSCMGLRVMR